jgi:hypothetical protein
VKNLQGNSVCEKMHQAIGNTLRVLLTKAPLQGLAQAEQLVDTAIADAVYTTHCTYNSVLKTTPGGLAFGRDMIINIPMITDLHQLQTRIDRQTNHCSQQQIRSRLCRRRRKAVVGLSTRQVGTESRWTLFYYASSHKWHAVDIGFP